MIQPVEFHKQLFEALSDTSDQQAPTSSLSTKQQPLPLTAFNLRLLGHMMAPPTTPKASQSKSQSKTSSSGDHAYDINVMLKRNNVFMDDLVAERDFPYVNEWALEISQTARHSPTSQESARKLQELLVRYGTRNEDTFLSKFWGKLFRESREVKDEVEVTNPRAQLSDLQPATWTSKSWDSTDLDDNWKQPFQRARGPDPTSSNDLNSIPNSVPDIAYGISRDAFSPAELGVSDSLVRYTGISRGILFPGMFVEAKTAGNAMLVDTQCARCGALTVRAMRHVLLALGDASVLSPGAETKTAVFSLSLTSHLASFHVHWAEVKPAAEGHLPLVKYHMHTFAQYGLKILSQIIATRQTLNSILDWVSLTRKAELKLLLESKIGTRLTMSIDNIIDVDDEDDTQAASGRSGGGGETAPTTPSAGFTNESSSKRRKTGH